MDLYTQFHPVRDEKLQLSGPKRPPYLSVKIQKQQNIFS